MRGPVEPLVVVWRNRPHSGWWRISHYQADGKPLMVGAPNDNPEYSISDWPDE